MDPIVTAEIPAPIPQKDPTESEVQAAKEVLSQLDAEARALGGTAAAAPVHYAMGRIFVEQLGDPKSAAVCYQNAYLLNPQYKPNLEAARRLFTSAGRFEKALALHQREELLLRDPNTRAESLRAQAVLLRELRRDSEAKHLVEEALKLAPEHPALLKASVDAAARDGDKVATAFLLLRSAGSTRDPVQKAQFLRRAVLLIEEMQAEPEAPGAPPTVRARPTAAELASLHEEAVQKLFQADANDQIGFHAMLVRARAANDWEAVLRLCRQRAERTESAADRALVAAIAAYRLARVSEGLAEVNKALEDHRRDGALLALRGELAEQQKSPDLSEILRQRAEGCIEPSERGHLKFRAALLLPDALEREQLLSEALAENPGDAAAIAVHARLVAQRDPTAAAERFVSMGEAIESHSTEEAAALYLEAGAWQERSGNREEAAALARRTLKLQPRHAGALRLLTRTLPATGASAQLADLLEEASSQLPRALGAEFLARAAALLSEAQGERSIALARRAAEMARGLSSPRWLETWAVLAFKSGDQAQLSQALEARADSTHGADAADLLLEASELARSTGDDARSTALLRKARGVDPSSAAARNALLALPSLPAGERVDLLLEEARQTAPERAAALHAERAAVLEIEGRIDEAVQACAQALALAGVDLSVLRRLARLQLRRADHAAALAVLVQIAEAVPEGHPRAEAYGRAAELAEWRVGDPRRAIELYRAAAQAHPSAAAFAWAQLGRLLAWTGRYAESAEAYEELSKAAQPLSERNEARRWAASLWANRAGQPAKAAPLLRGLLQEAPGDLEATADLLALIGTDETTEARKERAELRGRLASRCQDPRVAALLRAESAEDRMAAGDRDQGIAEYRRALALNPQDRVALDLVEDALRSSGQKTLLAEHLAFRWSFADGETRAALALQQAEIFTEQGRLADAGVAYNQALSSDPDSLLAVKGARHIAELNGDREQVMKLLAREATLARDPGLASSAMVEAALLAEDMGASGEAVEHLTSVLRGDPNNAEAALKLRGMLGVEAARQLAEIYAKIGEEHADAKLGALAWTQAASIKLHELNDAPGAFFASGRALARDADNPRALEARADSAEAAGRPQEAAEALQKRLSLSADETVVSAWKVRLGRLYAELGETEKALLLLGPALGSLEPHLLLKLAAGARSLKQSEAVPLYQRLLDAFPAPADPAPTRVQLAEWTDELARAYVQLGRPEEALAAFKRAVALEPRNRAALRHVADLSAQRAPEDSIAAHRALFDMSPPAADSLHKLVELFKARGAQDAAWCAAATLVGLGSATAEEKQLYEPLAARPPPVELPQLADNAAVHATGDEGAARDLLSAAATELARAMPTDMSGGRGALVKGDNPVRRVVAAIARALGIAEPQLFLARAEPGVVAAVSGDAPGLLVGAEVPKRYSPRQQRFLYARALAHIRRGTHPVVGLPAARVATIVGELVRIAAPAGTDFARLPLADSALGESLARVVGPEARQRLAALAAKAAGELPTNWEPLTLGIRESAERAGLAVSGDPAAALALVAGECQGGLDKPEVARLARFSVSEAYFSLRR